MLHLTCRSCGAKIDLPNEANWFICATCGAEYTVERGGGAVVFQPIGLETSPEDSPDEIDQKALASQMERLGAELADLERRMMLGVVIASTGTLVVLVALFLSEGRMLFEFSLALLGVGALITAIGGALWIGARDPIFLKRREIRRVEETAFMRTPDGPDQRPEGQRPD
ncbi:MAG: hypothetical protein M1358_12185 [Chloroflexi bacterium]|nr:hypothetical protein [Chloroflexota bacterium]